MGKVYNITNGVEIVFAEETANKVRVIAELISHCFSPLMIEISNQHRAYPDRKEIQSMMGVFSRLLTQGCLNATHAVTDHYQEDK